MTCCSPSIDQTLETQICPFPKFLITRIMQSRVWIHPLMTSSGIRGIHYIQFKRHWNPALQTLLNNEHPDFLDTCMRATANAHCNGGKPMQRQYLTPQQDLLIIFSICKPEVFTQILLSLIFAVGWRLQGFNPQILYLRK